MKPVGSRQCLENQAEYKDVKPHTEESQTYLKGMAIHLSADISAILQMRKKVSETPYCDSITEKLVYLSKIPVYPELN